MPGDGSWIDYEVQLSARSELSGGTIFIGENQRSRDPKIHTRDYTMLVCKERCVLKSGMCLGTGSHAGVFDTGSLGTNGFWPYYIHSSLRPPGFTVQISFAPSVPVSASTVKTTKLPMSNDNGITSWMLQAGTQGTAANLKCEKNACPTVMVGNGSLSSLKAGEWATVRLSATRNTHATEDANIIGKSLLQLWINDQLLVNSSVRTSGEARGAGKDLYHSHCLKSMTSNEHGQFAAYR